MKASPATLGRMLCCLAGALLLTVCVGVVPYPATSKVTHGQRLTADDVAFIQPGVTTREEVCARLGTNCIGLPKDRAIAYSWEVKGGGGFWWYCVIFGGAGATYNSGTWEGGWRAFFVAFDQQGVVVRTEFRKPSPRISLHEHLYAWSGTLAPPKPKADRREAVVVFGDLPDTVGLPRH